MMMSWGEATVFIHERIRDDSSSPNMMSDRYPTAEYVASPSRDMPQQAWSDDDTLQAQRAAGTRSEASRCALACVSRLEKFIRL